MLLLTGNTTILLCGCCNSGGKACKRRCCKHKTAMLETMYNSPTAALTAHPGHNQTIPVMMRRHPR